MMEFDVTADVKAAQRYYKNLQNTAIDKAAVRSLNRTASTVQTHARRNVSKQIGLPQKIFKRQIFIALKANRLRLTAIVEAKGKAINLIEFVVPSKRFPGAFRKKTGVTAKPYGKRKTYRGQFIGRGLNSGKALVFIRTSEEREPIRGTFGPSVPKTFLQKRILKVLNEIAGRVWKKEFEHNIRYYINKDLGL